MLAIGHIYRLEDLKSNFSEYGRGYVGRTPLMYAAINGDIKEARNRRRYTGEFDMMGCTALMYAAAENQGEILKLLVMDEKQMKMRCPVIVRDYTLTNVTALMVAAANNAIEAVKVLVEYEAGLRESQRFATALMIAALTGSTDCVAVLAEREAGLQDKAGRTALMYAVEASNYSCLDDLIPREKGMVDADGRSALHVAAMVGHVPTFCKIAQYEGRNYGQEVRALLLADTFLLCNDRKTDLLSHLVNYC